MEIITIALLAVVAGETSYLTYKTLPKNKIEKHSLLLDTSVLIDGRILSIARSGLITAPLVVPRSVIRELQYMADKADHDKRERAREGLDMIDQLQQIESLNITTIDDKSSETGVDERLVELAKMYDASLCTIDYNLNKSARAQNVTVVNINELAHALRIIHLPGEKVEIKLVQVGQGQGQAVGYLDDGTMVVVDDAKSAIGQTIETEVTRVLQTAAGKMMFAKKVKALSSARTDAEESGRRGINKKQPRTESERGSRSIVSKLQSRVAPRDKKQRTKESGADEAGVVEQQAPEEPKEAQIQQKRPNPSQSRRKRTPEDNLVNLANK